MTKTRNQESRALKTLYSPDHALRAVTTELDGGILIEPHERPSRAETSIAQGTWEDRAA